MTKIQLKNGPCDPREVEMSVTPDADAVFVRQMPFDVRDVYLVVDKFVEDGSVVIAVGEYSHTEGTRTQVNAYRQALTRIGAGRAFAIKRRAGVVVH